jgi:MFS family permease
LNKNKVLVSIMFFAGLANLILFTLPGAYLPFIIKNIINGNASDLALFNSFTAIGALIGSLILSFGNLSNRPGKLVFSFLIIWHFSMFLTSIITNKLLLTFILVIYGATGSITMISLAVLVLSITQKDMIGRIIGIRQLAIFTLPIGLVISGYLIDTIGIIFSIQSVTMIGLIMTLILGYKSKKFMNYKNIN